MGFNSAAEIDAWLRQGGTVVTASERTARAVTSAFNRARRGEGLKAWPTPNVLSWQNFVRAAWDERCADGRLVLNPLQELAVWEDILAASRQSATTLKPARRRFAAQAIDAHVLLASYAPEFLEERRRTGWQHDAETFSHWLSAFDETCRDHSLLSFNRLTDELRDDLQKSTDARPQLLLIGFDRLLPAQWSLLDAWGDWKQLDSGPPASEPKFYRASSIEAELAACAAWAHQQLGAKPDSRLLVITQNAANLRGQIERAFLDHCKEMDPPIFEFSLGVPLSRVSIVRSTSVLLDWLTTDVAEHELDWLFSTDFLTTASDENLALQSAMRLIRRRGRERVRWTIDAFLQETTHATTLTTWRSRIAKAQAILANQNATASPAEYAETTSRILHAVGWPGSRELTSPEYQALQRFELVIELCASLGFDGRLVAWRDFIIELRNEVADTLFSLETQEAPILIAGPAETAGLFADAIWFLGAHEDSWPATSDLHPLIPAAVQARFHMPHASAQVDWNLAASITRRLLTSAPEVTFSFPAQAEGIERSPSRLINQIVGMPIAIPSGLISDAVPAPRTKIYEDRSTIPVRPVAFEQGFHADSAALTAQSQCPFKGFATTRLGAKGWEPALIGLSPSARGQLLHTVLHSVWGGPPDGIKTLEQLITITDLEGFVTRHASTAMQRIPPAMGEQMPARYVQLEEERLVRLVCDWLEYEKARAAFEVVHVESKAEPVIGGLPMKLRLDRIDRLNDGSLLVIDYKTGDVTPKSWALPRPDDVQLPLYGGFGLGEGEQLGGLVFAKIRAGDVCFAGHIGDPTAVLGDVPNLSTLKRTPFTAEMLIGWREHIEKLARSFIAGNADVDPRDSRETCNRCGLQTLCRVHEQQNGFEDEDLNG